MTKGEDVAYDLALNVREERFAAVARNQVANVIRAEPVQQRQSIASRQLESRTVTYIDITGRVAKRRVFPVMAFR